MSEWMEFKYPTKVLSFSLLVSKPWRCCIWIYARWGVWKGCCRLAVQICPWISLRMRVPYTFPLQFLEFVRDAYCWRKHCSTLNIQIPSFTNQYELPICFYFCAVLNKLKAISRVWKLIPGSRRISELWCDVVVARAHPKASAKRA